MGSINAAWNPLMVISQSILLFKFCVAVMFVGQKP
jgi:hypothetical protein